MMKGMAVNNINQIAKQVKRECKDIHIRNDCRNDINNSTAAESSSSTLLTMMAALSPDLDKNMVTTMMRERTPDLQIVLDFKSLLTYIHDFGITCSYDEGLSFKKSAAV